jgi:hypothetical protein
MKTRNYLIFTSVIFVIVSLVHLVRLAEGWSMQIGTMGIPLWMSVFGLLVSGGAAFWGLSLLRRT